MAPPPSQPHRTPPLNTHTYGRISEQRAPPISSHCCCAVSSPWFILGNFQARCRRWREIGVEMLDVCTVLSFYTTHPSLVPLKIYIVHSSQLPPFLPPAGRGERPPISHKLIKLEGKFWKASPRFNRPSIQTFSKPNFKGLPLHPGGPSMPQCNHRTAVCLYSSLHTLNPLPLPATTIHHPCPPPHSPGSFCK